MKELLFSKKVTESVIIEFANTMPKQDFVENSQTKTCKGGFGFKPGRNKIAKAGQGFHELE